MCPNNTSLFKNMMKFVSLKDHSSILWYSIRNYYFDNLMENTNKYLNDLIENAMLFNNWMETAIKYPNYDIC